MKENLKIIKGDIAYSKEDRSLFTMKDGYLIIENNQVKDVYPYLPEEYKNAEVKDYSNYLIVPGMTDIHVHAPQYTFRGLGMDLELLDWLNTYTFPEEEKYQELEYAKKAYKIFVQELKNSYTTRACVYGTVHPLATLELMDQLEESGLMTMTGLVNMDRNGSEQLCNKPASLILQETANWIETARSRYERTVPILTPRFIPSCTNSLMEGLGKLAKQYNIRVQTHLSENLAEIQWVKELLPQVSSYGHGYELFQLFGSVDCPAVMAHCVYSPENEVKLMKEKGVFIAHCPDSNLNIASGIAPVGRYLSENIPIGIGTDVAGGAHLSMPRAVSLAIQCSKMYWRIIDTNIPFLSFKDGFYLATRGGGSYFGKVGAFEPGFDADVLVVDDTKIESTRVLTVSSRVERLIYYWDQCNIIEKYVAGRKICLKN